MAAIALVTGSIRVIGLGIATELARSGCHIGLNGFSELEEIERELKVAGKVVVGDSVGVSWPLILEWQLIYENLPFNQIRRPAAIGRRTKPLARYLDGDVIASPA